MITKKKPRFTVGQRVKIVRILDNITTREIIGYEGIITEVEKLPNGDFNYYVDNLYMHEEELEVVE